MGCGTAKYLKNCYHIPTTAQNGKLALTCENGFRDAFQNPSSVSSNLTEGTEKDQLEGYLPVFMEYRSLPDTAVIPQKVASPLPRFTSCGVERLRDRRDVIGEQVAVAIQRHRRVDMA